MTAPTGWCIFIATRKSLPLGGKVARYAPDEGEMSGSCPSGRLGDAVKQQGGVKTPPYK